MTRKHRNMEKITYSRRKRMTMDYRTEYFKHNPGLFGCIWTCAYCHAPIVGAHNVSVDHIIPLNSPLGRNSRFNLVAACRTCNLKKSDNVDFRVVQGYTAKVFQSIVFSLQKLVIVCFAGVWWLINKIIRAIFDVFRNLPFAVKAIIIMVILIFLIGR